MNGTGTGCFARLKQRKLVQWALAYVAGAFALIQVIDVVADSYDWPHLVMHLIFGLLAVGFVVMLVLAWYHGERGAQHVSGPELLLIALALVIGGGLLWHFGREGSPASPARVVAAAPAPASSPGAAQHNPGKGAALRIPAKSIAVLPFENLSSDTNNAYFVAGMQDLILTKLADIGDLKVIARTSTEQYQSHPGDLNAIAQQLGVATILEGSVQKAGKQVLINVQLINASTRSHIWAESYTRTLDNIFGVEGEVADKVARALNAKLTEAEAARVATIPTSNPAAYDAYLRGEFHMTSFAQGEMKPDVEAAVREYSDAVRQDPKFAPAWARLAAAQSFLGAMTHGDPKLASSLYAGARASINRAMTLQPDLADAFVSQGIYDIWPLGEWQAALQAFQKAHALQPQNAGALGWVAYALRGLGKANEYMRALQQLQVLDPKRVPLMLGNEQANLHHFKDAEQSLQRALAMNPDSWTALDSLASLYAYLGNLSAMGQLIESAPAAIRSNPNYADTVGPYLFYRRDWNGARKLYAQAKEPQNLRAAFYPIEIKRGDVEWYAGNKTAALDQYRRAIPLLEAQLKEQPDSRRWNSELGWVYARLGRVDDALRQGRILLESKDPTAAEVNGSPRNALKVARIEAQLGKTGDAIAILDILLAEPTGTLVSAPLLKIDPVWDPIRKDPRFQALLGRFGKADSASPRVLGACTGGNARLSRHACDRGSGPATARVAGLSPGYRAND